LCFFFENCSAGLVGDEWEKEEGRRVLLLFFVFLWVGEGGGGGGGGGATLQNALEIISPTGMITS